MKSHSNPAHLLSISALLDELREQGKRVYRTISRALAKDRELTGTERAQVWAAVDEAAEDQLRRWDYHNHPELK